MPSDVLGAADGLKACPDERCPGHAPQAVSVELRTRIWTRQAGHGGPVSIIRRERAIQVPEHHRLCATCGSETEISGLQTPPHGLLVWPEPSLAPGTVTVDEIIEPDRHEPTLEERVTALERSVHRLDGRW
jgi:hypothetical protein